MSLILAAAGRGSRLGELGKETPKALVREPVHGLPILHHLYKRLEMAQGLEHVIIVGANDSSAAEQLAAFTERFPFEQRPAISIVRGERRGVGFAFLLGIEHAISLGLNSAIVSVADSVASSYGALADGKDPVTIGVTDSAAPKGKTYSQIHVTPTGKFLNTEIATTGITKANVAGIYKLSEEALPLYAEVFREEIRIGKSSEAQNSKGEYRVSWVWKTLEERGCPVGTADVGDLVEVNFAEDLGRFREFFRD